MKRQKAVCSISTQVVYSIILFLLVSLIGCGYFDSGTWEDDPENWERAFSQKPPNGVEIVHSYYWKSPHWTYEFEYFFALRGTQKTHDLLFADDQLKKLDQNDEDVKANRYFTKRPSWFLPKTLDNYEVWIYRKEPRQNFRLFIDKASGEFFITDSQI